MSELICESVVILGRLQQHFESCFPFYDVLLGQKGSFELRQRIGG